MHTTTTRGSVNWGDPTRCKKPCWTNKRIEFSLQILGVIIYSNGTQEINVAWEKVCEVRSQETEAGTSGKVS